jgi:nucleotide-binding universal stress UspA family protein
MKMLMCHDGSAQTEKALRFAATIAKACHADVTLLGVSEAPGADAQALLQHLQGLRSRQEHDGLSTQILTKSGSPVEEILGHGEAKSYDIVVIGAGQPHAAMPRKTYELVRQIKPAVLLVVGERTELKNILLCSGGADYTEDTVQAAAQIASCCKAHVTLLHVLPEAPPLYSSIMAPEEDAEQILASDSTLGRNLLHQKELLEKLGVTVTARTRHGDVAEEVLKETSEANIDLIVVGSTVDRGPIYRYLLGDVTRQIVDRAPCPVLITRQKTSPASFWKALMGRFASQKKK